MKKSAKNILKIYNKRNILIIFLLILAALPFISTFSRYATDRINNFYTMSKEFYFNSDKLDIDNPVFLIENWSGVEDYTITINMNSIENNLKATSYDIPYNISYTASDNIICSLSKERGTIPTSTNSDSFYLTITPGVQLTTGDKVEVDIVVEADSNYEKTLKGRFVLVVGKEQLSYEIVDSVNNPYLDLNITNTISFYTVGEAFDSYNVGDKIASDVYLSLDDTNKNKCYSNIITLNFDPSEVVLDLTNTNYLNATSTATTKVDGSTYINGITFKMDAISSTKVRFYKNDITKNYTYPNGTNESIIEVNSVN